MKIRLKHSWFTPAGHRLRPKDSTASDGSFDVPDHWRDKLPPTAVVLDEKVEVPLPSETDERVDPAAELEKKLAEEEAAAHAAEDAAREAHNEAALSAETKRRQSRK